MKTKILILELSSNKTDVQKQTSTATNLKTRSHFFPYYQKRNRTQKNFHAFPFSRPHSHFLFLFTSLHFVFCFLLQQYFTQSFLDVNEYSNKNRENSTNSEKTVHVLVLSTPYLIHLFFFIFYSSGSKNFLSYFLFN